MEAGTQHLKLLKKHKIVSYYFVLISNQVVLDLQSFHWVFITSYEHFNPFFQENRLQP